MSIVNERIKERRICAEMTLLEVANALGITEATAQRYESGSIKNVKHETVSALADLFGCSPAYLMGWTNAPSPSYSQLLFRCVPAEFEGNHLEERRKQLGLTVEQICSGIFLDQSEYQEIVSGKIDPPLSIALGLYRILGSPYEGLDIDYLFTSSTSGNHHILMDTLSEQERALISAFRSASDHEKDNAKFALRNHLPSE